MDPVTALLAGGTAFKAVGSIMEGEAAGSAYNTKADQARENGLLAVQQAGSREEQQRRSAALQLGRQAAAISQSGIDSTSGSALAVAAQSATMAELDALNIRYEGAMQKYGYDREASSLRASAKNARRAGYWGAANSILGGAVSYAGMSGSGAPTIGYGASRGAFTPPGGGY